MQVGPSSPKLNIKSNLERKRTQTFTDWCCQSATNGKRYANTKQKYCQTIWNERKPGRFLVLLWIHHATAHAGNNLSALQFSFCGGEIARLKGIFPSDKGNEWSIVANYLYSKQSSDAIGNDFAMEIAPFRYLLLPMQVSIY